MKFIKNIRLANSPPHTNQYFSDLTSASKRREGLYIEKKILSMINRPTAIDSYTPPPSPSPPRSVHHWYSYQCRSTSYQHPGGKCSVGNVAVIRTISRTDTAWNAILKRTATRLTIAKCNNQIKFRMNEKEAWMFRCMYVWCMNR